MHVSVSRDLWLVSAALAVLGCSPTVVVQCVSGSAQLCACTTGATGSQTCGASGTFDACVCSGVDAGVVAPDAAMPDDDGGTPNDAHVDLPDAWSASCPAPLVTCGGACIDPMTNPAYCGATSDCSGANAGVSCTGTSCSMGRCVWDDCGDARAAGNTTDGLYFVDIDGSGPRAPMDAYCDMTTSEGGWTLVYKVGNTVPDIADPWFPMVALGSGTALPTTLTPLPSGTYFEGPDRATRAALVRLPTNNLYEWRAQLVSASGSTIFDVAGYGNFQSPIGTIVNGLAGAPTTGPTGSGASSFYVVGTSGTLPAVGTLGGENGWICDVICRDYDVFRTSDGVLSVPLVGDSSISTLFGAAYANTTAILWSRARSGTALP